MSIGERYILTNIKLKCKYFNSCSTALIWIRLFWKFQCYNHLVTGLQKEWQQPVCEVVWCEPPIHVSSYNSIFYWGSPDNIPPKEILDSCIHRVGIRIHQFLKWSKNKSMEIFSGNANFISDLSPRLLCILRFYVDVISHSRQQAAKVCLLSYRITSFKESISETYT